MYSTMTFPAQCKSLDCSNMMRPANATEEEYPNTVKHMGKGLCMRCYFRHRRQLIAALAAADASPEAQDDPQDALPVSQWNTRYAKPVKVGSWALLGKCNENPELFFGRGRTSVAARKICKDCPVRRRCAEVSIENREEWGVWGGLTKTDREQIIDGKATIDSKFRKYYGHASGNLVRQEESKDELVGVS